MTHNYKRSWYYPLAEATEFLEADFSNFVYPLHVHDTFAIGIIERGAQCFVTKAGEVIMPEAKLCVIDPDVVHEGWPKTDQGWRYRMFYPSPMVVANALEVDTHTVEELGFGRFVLSDPALYRRFQSFHLQARAGVEPLLIEQIGIAFLRDLFSRHAKTSLHNERACSRVSHLCQSYIDEHQSDRIVTRDLAEISGVSETQVIRSFTQIKGMSPHAYLIAKRVEKAKSLLATGSTASKTALDCGFVDQSHMHRYFKQIVGVTPGQFAQDVVQHRAAI